MSFRRITIASLLLFTALPSYVSAHHISSSASTWSLRADGASVDFQYPLPDAVILVAPDRVLKQETYIEVIGDVDDALLEKTTSFLQREIPQKIRLSGCSYKAPLNIRYQTGKINVHGELTCEPGYINRLKLEDRFLPAVNRLHVSLATLDTGAERFKCLFRAGLYECEPKASGAAVEAIPWKDVMGKGEVLIFYGWEQLCFILLLILLSSNSSFFAKYLATFITANLLGIVPLLVGRLPAPSQIAILPPLILIYGGLISMVEHGWWNRRAWFIYWLGHATLLLLSIGGIFRTGWMTIAGMALIGYGILGLHASKEAETHDAAWSIYIFSGLFGILHGFALADGLRNYNTLGISGLVAAIGFDFSRENWQYLFMVGAMTSVVILKIKMKNSRSIPAVSAAISAAGLCWVLHRGINLPGGGLDYKESVEALKNIIQNPNISPRIVLVSLLLAVILGAIHALTPGHGKTVVAAYLVGSKGKIADAMILGLTVTITHTSSVLVLGVIALVASKSILPGDLTPWLGGLSGIIIVIMGSAMFVTRFKNWRRTGEAIAVHDHDHFGIRHTHPHRHNHHDHNDHNHNNGHNHEHEHEHYEERNGVRLLDLITLGISGGLVPCPDAFVVLLIAVAVGRIALGILLIVMFSMGLAAVLITIGILMVKARPIFDKLGAGGGLIRVAMPLVSAALVTIIGIAITYESLLKVL